MNSALRDGAILRASWRIFGSSSSAHVMQLGTSASARTSGTSSSAESTPRSRPAAIARQPSVASWQVNALVEATQTSGPASVGNTIWRARHCPAWHVDNRKDALPMSFGEFQRGERVGGLSGLRYKQRSPDCRNRAARYINVLCERLADHPRLVREFL